MTHVTCPYCGQSMSKARIHLHTPRCPLKPDVWQRLVSMWMRHGYITQDMHNAIRDPAMPSVAMIRDIFGNWLAYIDRMAGEVDIEIPDQVRHHLARCYGRGKYPPTLCDCGHSATVVVWLYVRGGYHPVRQEMPLCSDCFDWWQEDEDPNGWGVVSYVNEGGN